MSDTEAKPSANMFTDKPLAGQHAVVTGGSRGIGATVSAYLARMGAKISLTARNPDTLDTHAETLRKAHGNQVFTKAGDMSKEGDIVAAFEGAGAAERDRVILLTADHGESLGESGFFFQHGELARPVPELVPAQR